MYELRCPSKSFASEIFRKKTCFGARKLCDVQQVLLPEDGFVSFARVVLLLLSVGGKVLKLPCCARRQYGMIQGNLRNLSRYGMLIR